MRFPPRWGRVDVRDDRHFGAPAASAGPGSIGHVLGGLPMVKLGHVAVHLLVVLVEQMVQHVALGLGRASGLGDVGVLEIEEGCRGIRGGVGFRWHLLVVPLLAD